MSDDRPEQDAPQQDPVTRQAMDRLHEQNRIQLEARMAAKALSKDDVERIRERFAEYVQSHGVELSVVARQTNYSLAVVSAWHAGKYKGNAAKAAVAINAWLERDARRAQAERPKDSIDTRVADDIRSIVNAADKLGKMAAIVCPSGAGKTFVLKALAEETRGLYIYCHDGMRTREFLMTIALALGFRKSIGTQAELHRFIVANLKGTRRIIFLDEAHRLGKVQLGFTRSIYDEAQVPIVLAGTADILEAINEDRASGRGQFASRTIRYNTMDHVRNAEAPDGGGAAQGRDLFSVDEVKRFFEMKKIRLNRDAMMLLWALACLPNFGCLRLIESCAETAIELNRGVDVLTREMIVEALKLLHGSDAIYMERMTDRHIETRPAKVA
jgi:DNA transposition AAA+ family ATPase